MTRNKITQIIGQLEKSISEIENELDIESFSDYCDYIYGAISYWRKLMKNIEE